MVFVVSTTSVDLPVYRLVLPFQLVDLALLVKQDMAPKAGDPFSHAISATFIQYHNSTEVNLAFSHITAFSVLLLHVFGSLLLSNVIESSIDTDFCYGVY